MYVWCLNLKKDEMILICQYYYFFQEGVSSIDYHETDYNP
jgi:hypothetical protein